MSEPLVLVVLLGTSTDPTSEAMVAAARRALGQDAVVLADTSDAQTDGDALAIGERVHALAIARVTWADASFQRARLHVHVSTATEWADDEIRFLPRDAAHEKGRTVGYALASMVQRIARSAPATNAGESATETSAPPAVAVAKREEPATHETPSRPPASHAPDVDVFAQGVGAIGGGATAAGGAGGVRYWFARHVGIRLAAGGRVGSIAEAYVSTTTLSAAAGPSYRVFVGSSVELGARADFVLLHHAARRVSDVDTLRTRWLGAVDLMVEASWALGAQAGLIAAVGAELAFGATTVTVGGRSVADIPPARALAELGLRIRF